MKKLSKLFAFAMVLALTLAMLAVPCNAATTKVTTERDYDGTGCYFETVIETTSATASKSTRATAYASGTKTGTKTTYYKNSSGTTLWYVRVTATFSYTGSSAKCTSSSVTAASNSSAWKVSNKSTSRSGASASATATGKRYFLGICQQAITKTVKLTCSSNGSLS